MNLYENTIRPLTDEYSRCKKDPARDAMMAFCFVLGLAIGSGLTMYLTGVIKLLLQHLLF